MAWLLLTANKTRLAVSVARVAFAVVLMFIQWGFLVSCSDSARPLFEALDADLYLLSVTRHTTFMDEEFPRQRLEQARAVPGVESASALWFEDLHARWKHQLTRADNPVRVIAFDPAEPAFRHPGITAQVAALKEEDTALFDTGAREAVGTAAPGAATELNRRRVRVAGVFHLGTDYRYDGNVLLSEANFFRYFPQRKHDRVALGLLRLRPGSDPTAVAAALRRALPPDVEVMSREALLRREAHYWRTQAPTGIVFGFGVLVGLAVGSITCYQIVYSDVQDSLPQLAMLKAIGHPDRALTRIVFAEAFYLAALGFVPGALLSYPLYAELELQTGMRMSLPASRVAALGALTLLMATVSALLAVREAHRADPAELLP